MWAPQPTCWTRSGLVGLEGLQLRVLVAAGDGEPGPALLAAGVVGHLDDGQRPGEPRPLLNDPAGDGDGAAGQLVAPPGPVDDRQQAAGRHRHDDDGVQDAQRPRRPPVLHDGSQYRWPPDRDRSRSRGVHGRRCGVTATGRARRRRRGYRRERSSATSAGTAARQSAVMPTSAAAKTGTSRSALMARIVPAERTPTMWLNFPERAMAT